MKKIVLFMLLLCMSFSSVIYATDLSGDLTFEEGGKEYINNYIDERNRNDVLNKYKNKFSILSDYYNVSLMVTPFSQLDNYCGPATVKQTLNYINGTSNSQEEYARELGTTNLGTDMTLISNVLNSHQNKHTYTFTNFSNMATWIYYVMGALDNDVPAIIDINSYGIVGWPYLTDGHFLNVSGLHIDGNVIVFPNNMSNLNMEEDTNIKNIIRLSSSMLRCKVTDPYQVAYGNRWYDLNLVYNVNRNHFRSAIIH